MGFCARLLCIKEIITDITSMYYIHYYAMGYLFFMEVFSVTLTDLDKVDPNSKSMSVALADKETRNGNQLLPLMDTDHN